MKDSPFYARVELLLRVLPLVAKEVRGRCT
jgi:hypothetical protein